MSRREYVVFRFLIIFSSFAVIATYSSAAYAYIGPGLGAGAIAAVLGLIGAFFLAVFAIVYYPVKRAIRAQTKKRDAKLQ